VTGVSAIGIISDFTRNLGEKTGLEIWPLAVKNSLFGTSVTVSGLVAGNDIISTLQGIEIGAALLVPDVMIKEGEGLFLDDVSLDELGQRLGCRVVVFDSTPQGCYRALRGLSAKPHTRLG
jgi:NifB/MoaA-like Fe-S oxidoreductase